MAKTVSENVILGIDPGTNVLGYSVIEQKGKQITLLEMNVLKLGKIKDMSTRMKELFDVIVKIIDKYNPDILSIEAAFSRSIPFVEYSPRKIKQSITGNGASSKEQVALMLQRMVEFDMPKYLDATDALAVAICHFHCQDNPIPTVQKAKKQSSKAAWGSFVEKNPNKLV